MALTLRRLSIILGLGNFNAGRVGLLQILSVSHRALTDAFWDRICVWRTFPDSEHPAADYNRLLPSPPLQAVSCLSDSDTRNPKHMRFSRLWCSSLVQSIMKAEQAVSSKHWRYVSTAATEIPEASSMESVNLTDRCIKRLREIQQEDGPESPEKMLRLTVNGGGCSGFMYNFSLDDKQNQGDRSFEKDGVKIIIDDISFSFVKGSTIDFSDELIRAAFCGGRMSGWFACYSIIVLYTTLISSLVFNVKEVRGMRGLGGFPFGSSPASLLVSVNPNASSGCGCGASFTAK